MGEIATWSAVKTKVGLGKTGNDCPTKAELLALSPTGTGESYVGLELSNASSYKDTECVKLEDIHKVTYKYTFTLSNSTLNFTALGGAPTNAVQGFGGQSYREKYLDGVTTGVKEQVSYNTSGLPSWVTWSDAGGWSASENTALTTRSKTDGKIVQQGSGKTFTIGWSQAAASQSWTYGWSVDPTSISFFASGGTRTFTVTSYKQEVRNGHYYGNQVTLTYTRTNTGSVSGTGTSVIMTNNTSTSAKSGTVTLTQAETGKKLTISCSQSAGYLTYSEITASGGAVTDIPASGGTRSSFTTLPTYAQTYGWNGSTQGAGTVNSGATITYSAAVTATSLGTTAKARTLKGTLTATISLNGKTKTIPIDVYQAENKITSTTTGSWSVKLTAGTYTVNNGGEDVSLFPSATAPKTNHWSSGATSSAGQSSAIPTLSIEPEVSGFTIVTPSGSAPFLRVTENTGTSSRSARVYARYQGVSDYVDITQSAATVTYTYTFKDAKPLTFSALGGAPTSSNKLFNATSTKQKYINGVASGSPTDVDYDSITGIPSWLHYTSSGGYVTAWTADENTGAARSFTHTLTQKESGKTLQVNVSQSGRTESNKYYLGFDSPTGSKTTSKTVVATANTIGAISAYAFSTKVINGTENTGTRYPSGLTVSSKPTWVTVNITHQGDGLYSIRLDITENTSTSSRSGSVVIKPNDNDDYGWELTINISQNAATITYEYIFEIA